LCKSRDPSGWKLKVKLHPRGDATDLDNALFVIAWNVNFTALFLAYILSWMDFGYVILTGVSSAMLESL
jgi:hypothetical protein